MNKRQVALQYGWRSGLEQGVAASLDARGVSYTYETLVLEWVPEQKMRRYTPDFIVTTESGKVLIIETKGRWLTADRMKMKQVVAQHPDKDIRMVFQNPNARISKVSKTTYADWCDKHLGIPWAGFDVPTSWLRE